MELNDTLPTAIQHLRSTDVVSENVIETLSRTIINAVKRRVDTKVGIGFSGGVDSTLLAYISEKLGKEFTLYTVGLPDAKDILAAQTVADAMDWPLKVRILELGDIEAIIREVIRLTGRRDPVTVGVGGVTYSVLSMMTEPILLTGLGSEEIFAGYERHTGDITSACWEGLTQIWDRDITRDLGLARSFGKELRLPFMDQAVIAYGMKIDPRRKVVDGHRKYVLREVAVHLGIPKEFAFRKKIAAQYGSKLDAAIEKLAKKNGMKKRSYLESL